MQHNFHATALGYAGLLPFIGLPFLIVWGSVSYFEGISFFSQYSALILSFLGGTVWWHTLQHKLPVWHLYTAMLPSLIGWFSLALLPPQHAISLLAIAFVLMLVYELSLLSCENWYRSLRIRLTAITCGGHLMLLWLIVK